MVRTMLPRTLNLAPIFQAATFAIDGAPARFPRWRKWRHHETLEFKGIAQARTLTVTIDGVPFDLAVHPVDDGLAGLNAVYTMSRDNDLGWITDWLRFHVARHDLQAVVLFDNGSTGYALDSLDRTIAAVPGIRQVRVVDASLPYGPLKEDCTNRSDAKYLQVAMLNLARDRFLVHSRAWMTLDIDELLLSPTGESIFDATAASRLGHLTFPGIWHYPDTGSDGTRYADHHLVRIGDAPCPTKYALQPDGLLGDFALQVHSLEKIHRKYNLAQDRFWFMHCYGISTSWKYARTAPQGTFSPASDLAQAALDAVFET